jgi:hypothetical protein
VLKLANRSQEMNVDTDNMSINQTIEPGKVVIVVLDGHRGKAKKFEAVEHGLTIIETVNGKAARIRFEEGELF